MDRNEQRIAKLKSLVEGDGGPADFARKRSQPDADKPIDPTYISQLLNGHRKFGEKAAENMCRRAGLPPGFFDSEDGLVDGLRYRRHEYTQLRAEETNARCITDPLMEELTQIAGQLNERGKIELIGMAKVLLSTCRDESINAA